MMQTRELQDRKITEPTIQIRYVIISPVRDEEKYIEKTICCVVGQTIRPAEWIIVNDGSRDRTGDIIDSYATEHRWIRAVHLTDRGQRVPGAGVIEAFYAGFQQLTSSDWQFVAKLDGDVHLEPDYFERCFERFTADPRLGICGGLMYCAIGKKLRLETHPAFHVRGPIKLYKRQCWDAIGGLIKAAGWDTVDELQANRMGWRTHTFSDLTVVHLRPTGAVQGFWRDGVKMGRAAYFSGYHPLFMLVKCFKRVKRRPYFVSALAHGYGYCASALRGASRVDDSGLIRYTRQQQLRRLLLLDSIWK